MSDKKMVKFDKEVPENAGKTAIRLFSQLKNQRGRLIVIAVCVVCYVVLNIFTPYYSAGVIDHLLTQLSETAWIPVRVSPSNGIR